MWNRAITLFQDKCIRKKERLKCNGLSVYHTIGEKWNKLKNVQENKYQK